MSEPKVYINGVFIREKKFSDGGAIMNLDINVEELVAALYSHADQRGFAHFVIGKRREEGKGGITHYMHVSTYVPKTQPPAQPPASQPAPAAATESDVTPF
jgi:hypothetical protein